MRQPIHTTVLAGASVALLTVTGGYAESPATAGHSPPVAANVAPGHAHRHEASPTSLQAAQTPIERVPDLSHSLMSARLDGLIVRDKRGVDIGVVDQLIISPDGRVTHTVVAVGGILGFGQSRYLVPWNQLHLEPGHDYATIDVTEGRLRSEFAAFEPAEGADQRDGANADIEPTVPKSPARRQR